jgi:hypothetical protein
MNHEPTCEWDVYGRLSKAPCLCDRCERRRALGALVLLVAGAASAVGLVAWACLR